MSRMLVSNNPLTFALQLPEWACMQAHGPALRVLEQARDAIHAGWRLLLHPLYGNYRPHQQPYRTLILAKQRESARARSVAPSGVDARIPPSPDAWSLHLIEEAFAVYRSAPVLTPDDAPASLLQDCARIDFELVRLTLHEAGWAEDAV